MKFAVNAIQRSISMKTQTVDKLKMKNIHSGVEEAEERNL